MIALTNTILPKQFNIARRSPKHPKVDNRDRGELLFHIGLIVSLVIIIALTIIFQRDANFNSVSPYIKTNFTFIAEDIPETRQTIVPPQPRLPTIPVVSEEIELPLEELEYHVEVYDFDFSSELPSTPFESSNISTGPRPLEESIPRFPQSEINKGSEGSIEVLLYIDAQGNVTNADIVSNSTDSKKLEELVLQSALKSKYRAARDKNNRPVASRTTRTYSFKRQEE